MIKSMDLNASPLPEDDDEPYEEQIKNVGPDFMQGECIESAAETMRREREERIRNLKRKKQDEGANIHSQPPLYDYYPHKKSSRKSREIPQGWLDCPSYGNPIDYIIPSKVPLDESYNDSVPPGKRYSWKQVIDKQRKHKREIGLVLDLTNTTRYYGPSEFMRQGIKYLKIPCKGRDAVPDNESVNRFVHEVMQFLERQKNSKHPKFILVHCTHGYNRTGFMIVNYLMRSQVSNITEALHIFAEKRPPGIYKHDYIQSLYAFYHEVPENLECPPTPEWKRPSDLDLNGEAAPDEDDDGDTSSLLQAQPEPDNTIITNDDVLGDDIHPDQQDILRVLCYQLLGLHNGKGNMLFPGSHPVSLDNDNLKLLRQKYYFATWKADGTRYMMLIMRYGCFLVDRNFCFRRVQLRFPLKIINEGFHDGTLIDGEMIIDKLPDAGYKRRYLAYDLMALNGSSKVNLPFSERWKLLEEEIVRPRNQERKQFEYEGKVNPLYRYDMELFGVRRKDFWLLSTVRKLLDDFIKKLSHQADGLVFQGWDDPYVTRTHEGLLKWKYPEMNTVDFLFEIGSDNRQFLFLYERGKKKHMDRDRVIGGEYDISALSGKIIECFWNSKEACWQCMRIRTDKNTPNDINTFRKVMRSISDNITKDVLLTAIDETIRLPMYADRLAQLQHHRRK